MHRNDVPVFIVSASFTPLVEAILEAQGLQTPNIRILANEFHFDTHQRATGFKEPILHSLNKQEVFHNWLTSEGNCTEEVLRPHALVLGDSVEDLGITDGLNLQTLCIGWMHSDEREAEFKQTADALVLGDAGMNGIPPLSPEFWEPRTVSQPIGPASRDSTSP